METKGAPGVVWIRLLPVALLLIVGATAIAADTRSPAIGFISWSLNPRDFALNILLFVPLGAALAGRPWSVVIAISCLLSLGVEVSQLAHFGRHAGPADVLANTAGGLLGSLVRHVRTRRVHVELGTIRMSSGLFLVVAVFFAAAPLFLIALPGTPHDFSNWDSTYGMAISNEFTGDRTWEGTLVAWAVYDLPMGREDIRELGSREFPDDARSALSRLPLDPVASWENPDPQQPSGFFEMSREASTKIHDRLEATGTMSLLAWFRVKDLEHSDDERIVTFSRDQFQRNFTLCQDGAVVAFRLRTPATGVNGMLPHARTPEILEPGGSYFVAATYDGFVSRVFVDGELMGRESLAASAAAIPSLHDAGLPLMLALSGGGLAGLLIVLYGRSERSSRWLLGGAAGLGAVAVVWMLGGAPVWLVHPVTPLWRIAPPLAGGLVVALSLTLGPPPSTDRQAPERSSLKL